MFEYEKLTQNEQEDYLELAILKYLQVVQNPVERVQILDYLSKHDIFIPWEEFEPNSNGTDLKIKPRFSFALTSLEHAGLVCHPQRGMTALTDLGNKTRTSDTHVVKELVTAGWQKYNESKD